jgi:hypothetical protein
MMMRIDDRQLRFEDRLLFLLLRATHRRACRYDQTGLAEWIAPWANSYVAILPGFPGPR